MLDHLPASLWFFAIPLILLAAFIGLVGIKVFITVMEVAFGQTKADDAPLNTP